MDAASSFRKKVGGEGAGHGDVRTDSILETV